MRTIIERYELKIRRNSLREKMEFIYFEIVFYLLHSQKKYDFVIKCVLSPLTLSMSFHALRVLRILLSREQIKWQIFFIHKSKLLNKD